MAVRYSIKGERIGIFYHTEQDKFLLSATKGKRLYVWGDWDSKQIAKIRIDGYPTLREALELMPKMPGKFHKDLAEILSEHEEHILIVPLEYGQPVFDEAYK